MRTLLSALLTAWGAAFAACSAEAPGTSSIKHWGVSPRTPDGGLIRFEGAEARPLPGGLWEVSEFKLESIRPNGKKEMLVEAPKCVVDVTRKIASSDGALAVTREESGVSLTGVGFLYNELDKRLIISNRSRIVIHATLFKEGFPAK